jgi:HD-GYP domain-containing protein (c-di-GMP phosphodiesterase class II)
MQNVQSELAQTSEALNNLITEMIRSPGPDLGCVREIAGQTVSIVADDPDLAIFSMLLNGGREYPTSHCQRVSILATAMGAAIGLQESELRDLATGCMLHDTGMLLLKEPLYLYPRALTESEIVELKRHPSLVFDVLSNSPAISARAALVAYQVHERDDGSGYPRGRRGDQIHPLSKIAAVADSYIAKISDRPYRPAMSPYRAMEVMLVETGRRQFDPRAVRALLKAESLFPVGSTVELSTGETAQVIRSTPEDYMHPVVSVLSGGPPRIVNLAEERDISIVTESRTETSALAEEVALSCENDADDLDGLSAECAALDFQEEADGDVGGSDDGGPFEDESDTPQE